MKIQIEVTIPDDQLLAVLTAGLQVITGKATTAAVEIPVGAAETEAAPPKTRKSKAKAEEPAPGPEPEAKAAEPEQKPAELPSMDDVLKKAEAFLKSSSDGPAKMAKLLQKIGCKRVREIPAEKLPEFLALLAVE